MSEMGGQFCYNLLKIIEKDRNGLKYSITY